MHVLYHSLDVDKRVFNVFYVRRYLTSYCPLTTRSTLIGRGIERRLKNAGRLLLQVPEIGFFLFEKDSWRFGGGEWLHVINAL